jgi:hypothetical protein
MESTDISQAKFKYAGKAPCQPIPGRAFIVDQGLKVGAEARVPPPDASIYG